jgi:hypothetical protein
MSVPPLSKNLEPWYPEDATEALAIRKMNLSSVLG